MPGVLVVLVLFGVLAFGLPFWLSGLGRGCLWRRRKRVRPGQTGPSGHGIVFRYGNKVATLCCSIGGYLS